MTPCKALKGIYHIVLLATGSALTVKSPDLLVQYMYTIHINTLADNTTPGDVYDTVTIQ